MATGVSSTWRNHSSSGYLLVIIMETKGGCHCHAHALVHHHHRLPPPRAPTPTTHTAAPPTAQMRIFLRFLVRKWTRTGSSYVLGHADSAMTCLNNCHTSWKAVDAIKTKNRLMVTIHSKDVTEILPLYRMTKFDFPPHFLKGLMHSFPMMYNTQKYGCVHQ